MCAGTSRFGLSGYFGLSLPVHLNPAMLRGMPLAVERVSERRKGFDKTHHQRLSWRHWHWMLPRIEGMHEFVCVLAVEIVRRKHKKINQKWNIPSSS
jgi:hypothetical protein